MVIWKTAELHVFLFVFVVVLIRLFKSDPAQLFEKLEIQARYSQHVCFVLYMRSPCLYAVGCCYTWC